MNLPNALTISRLVAIPPLMFLLLARFDYHDQVAAAVFIVFSLTDTMDGQIARRQGTVSAVAFNTPSGALSNPRRTRFPSA